MLKTYRCDCYFLAAGLDPWATPQAYDNIKDFFQTGHTWSTSVNVAQSFDRGNFSISLGNTNQDGIVGSTGLDRYNAKIGAEGKLHNNWDAGFVGNFVSSKVSKQTSANNGIVATVYGAPSSYDLKGIPSHVLDDPYTQNNYRNTSGFDNAYWALDNNKFTEKNNRFFGNVFTKYSTKFNTTNHKLDVKYQLGTDSYTTKYSDLWGFGHTDKKGSITHTSYSILDFNSLLTASYYWTINDKWTFDAIYGNEFIDSKTDVVEAYGAEFNSSGWNHINNTSTRNASESYSKRRTVGNFVSASLAFNKIGRASCRERVSSPL